MLNLIFWKMMEPGKRWCCVGPDGEILGFIRCSESNTWDAFVCTGKKWPDGDKQINSARRDRSFYAARRCVESTLEELAKSDDTLSPISKLYAWVKAAKHSREEVAGLPTEGKITEHQAEAMLHEVRSDS